MIAMRFLFILAALMAVPILVAAADSEKKTASDGKVDKVAPVLNFKMKGIDGKDVDLSGYQGKVIMFVNVASKCGLTPQYEALQSVYDKYSKDGLVIIGVPANEFGRQEPGSNAEIAKFCKANYNVTFPMLSKVVVKGKGISPLYKFLISKETDPKFAGELQWNFTKFLISRKGEIVNRFEPRVKPDSKDVISAIEAELKK
jgi:glutathione peroxidase